MDIKLIFVSICMLVGYARSAPTTATTTPVYPWQRPIACTHCQGGSDGGAWGGVTPPPSERANTYYVISTLANNVRNNITDIINNKYLGLGLIDNSDKNELDSYGYPALNGFPTLPSLPTHDVKVSIERAYTNIQIVSSFVEQVRKEHELQASVDSQSAVMDQLIRVSLQTTGLHKISAEVCCTVTSHGITHPTDITMEIPNQYEFPQSHSYPERYRRDYLILRDSAKVMEYIHNEFKRHHEAWL